MTHHGVAGERLNFGAGHPSAPRVAGAPPTHRSLHRSLHGLDNLFRNLHPSCSLAFHLLFHTLIPHIVLQPRACSIRHTSNIFTCQSFPLLPTQPASTSFMSSEVPPARGTGRGRGRGRGRSDGARNNATRGRSKGRGGQGNRTETAPVAPPTQGDAPPPTKEGKAAEGAPSTDDGDEVCFICADPIKFHSVTPCNHKTCHLCGLRMRALYKTKDCPHCRVSHLGLHGFL